MEKQSVSQQQPRAGGDPRSQWAAGVKQGKGTGRGAGCGVRGLGRGGRQLPLLGAACALPAYAFCSLKAAPKELVLGPRGVSCVAWSQSSLRTPEFS